LVGLSTKHGILTPYTSFLADETTPAKQLADTRLHLESAGRTVERLREAEGIQGFSQRSDKFDLQNAPVAQSAPAPAFRAAGGGGFRGGGVGGRMPGGPGGLSAGGNAGAGAYGPALRGSNTYRDIDSDKKIVADGIQNVGKETLYRRGKQWIANN